jgi:6-phosphogluconolactonase
MGRDAVRIWRLLGVVLAAVALTVPALASAANQSSGKKVNYDAFYTQSNNPAGNTVIAFRRAANGMITQSKVVNTGGKGAKATPPFGFPIADGSGSVDLTPNGKLLFVVNAGDNSVSSFQITASGPKLVSHVSSHGKLPISLTSSGDLLYVVNETSANIFGWRFSSTGKLTPIAGSDQKLTAVTPKGKKDKVGVTAGIGFADNGRVLAVTERGLPRHYGEIDTFVVKSNGSAGPSHAFATPGIANVFGFSATGQYLLVSNAGYVATASGVTPNPADFTQFTGSAATYKVSTTGTLKLVKNTPTNGRAACWLVVTKNGKTAFVTNTLSSGIPPAGGPTSGAGAVSSLSVAGNGKMTLAKQANTGPGFPSDEALSADGKYLYVTDASVILPFASHIDVYRLGPGGTMTHIQATPDSLPSGVSGAGAF